MRTLYLAANPVDARLAADFLAGHGIAVHIFDEFAWGGRGDLPVDQFPRLMIEDESQYERGRALLKQYERGVPGAPPWTCPNCAEGVDRGFDLCWNCGGERP
ncbi:MAG: DUF2007 domain-containing protein [Pseudomonadota bacterium]|jgi:hypothetical protein|nr:DUF2007 domain-containing protein [Pseudomonadota bacterium]